MIDSSKNTIVFDFGNVLIDLDFERCFQYFERILNVDWSDRKLPDSIVNAIKKYDRGQISDEALIWAFQNVNPTANPRDIIKAWNSLIGTMPESRFAMLEKLREHYNLCILSNINSMHIDVISAYFKKSYGLTDFEDRYFDHVFYSHEIGKRKPDPEIYQYVQDTLNVEPYKLLFIDDLKENIAEAKKAGWFGHVHNPKKGIETQIESYLTQSQF